MNLFLLNILLAVMWMLFWGWPSLYTFIAGFVVGYIVLGLVSRAIDVRRNYASAAVDLAAFLFYFLKILLISNLQVAREVLTPGMSMTPRFIRYPIHDLTDIQITTLANTISLTPGTLSVDVADDKQWLYIHAMYAKDRQDAVRAIDELRSRILRLVFAQQPEQPHE
jgi:multicomponent Na+:H+ antiporter subunit E